ncbi:PTS ascorbate-specific transporter subunit IIA [Psittacicella melopsittaci]|uniref:Ascorbate-specific PTS system EIIA component n=1 Tax=Psittacicella melopsittaci TaxID=2028576 RepID=A0A3A1Y257_9GAMM|nr:PTS sugar transporter subunit IIA [Psittacicella melopsittaci]RIY32313.1 PTS ascorbate-specific transporter subunit IIA [Psittacicella melopsittaci]
MTVNLRDSLIENNSVLLNQSAATWEQAVKIGTDLLEKSGAITPQYYQTIVKSVNELGPYFILCPGLAMPHARPEDGVNFTAFAIVTLSEPVEFSDGSQADVFFTLAGADATSHGYALTQLMQIIDDEDSEDGVDLSRFRNCTSVEEVLKVVETYGNV